MNEQVFPFNNNFRILVVDDDENITNLISELLCSNNEIKVEKAKDGLEGLNKLKKSVYDIIITDIKMPVMDGIEFLQRVRNMNPGIPVVIMSAYAEFDSLVKALHLGATNFIRKPFDFDEIFQVILKVLNLKNEFIKQSKIFPHVKIETSIEMISDIQLVDGVIVYLTIDLLNYQICDKGELGNFRLALHEAVTNAIEHGNMNDMNKKVHITKQIDNMRILYRIEDEGKGFDYKNIPDPTLPENLMKPRGRGLLLMHTFMDEIIFKKDGTVVELIKYKKRDKNDQDWY